MFYLSDMWGQQEAAIYSQEKRPHQNLPMLASRNVENKFLLFKPPGLWYFVMATQADEYNVLMAETW